VQQQGATRQGQKGEVAAFRGSAWPLEDWAPVAWRPGWLGAWRTLASGRWWARG